jgi:enoyl-CoA hydratase/carnithine racemase
LSGFVLGAGAGLAAQARFRVADASVQWGMPELQIGLFPDVGSRYFLRQLSQPLALYLAMSSVRLSVSDLSFAGFIDAVVDTDAFVTIKDALCATSWDHLIGDAPAIAAQVKACLLEQTTDQPLAPSSLARHHQTILKAFANINQADALAELAEDSPWGEALAASIQSYAPTVRAWIWHLFREAPIPASYRAALSGDYRLGQHFLGLPDFKEGIRAAIIDKDRQPVWSDFDPSAFQKHLAAWQAADQEDALNWVWV